MRGVRLKIKWNDDRVAGATTAILLIARDRLSRGQTENLIRASLAEFRSDPAGFKQHKRTWADVREVEPLTAPAQMAYYRNLLSASDGLVKKVTQEKRQFSSLLELDNFLVASLGAVR